MHAQLSCRVMAACCSCVVQECSLLVHSPAGFAAYSPPVSPSPVVAHTCLTTSAMPSAEGNELLVTASQVSTWLVIRPLVGSTCGWRTTRGWDEASRNSGRHVRARSRVNQAGACIMRAARKHLRLMPVEAAMLLCATWSLTTSWSRQAA